MPSIHSPSSPAGLSKSRQGRQSCNSELQRSQLVLAPVQLQVRVKRCLCAAFGCRCIDALNVPVVKRLVVRLFQHAQALPLHSRELGGRSLGSLRCLLRQRSGLEEYPRSLQSRLLRSRSAGLEALL